MRFYILLFNAYAYIAKHKDRLLFGSYANYIEQASLFWGDDRVRLKEYILRLKALFSVLNRVYRVNKALEDMLPKEKRAINNSVTNHSISNRVGERVKSETLNNKNSLRNVHNNIKNIYNNGLNKRVSYKNRGDFKGFAVTGERYVNSLKNRVINRADFKSNYSYAYGKGKDKKIKSINKLSGSKSLSHINTVNKLRRDFALKQENLKPLSLERVGKLSFGYGRASGQPLVNSKVLNLYKINLPEIKAVSRENGSTGASLKWAALEKASLRLATFEKASLKSVATGVSLKSENVLIKSATATAPIKLPVAVRADLKYKMPEGLISPKADTVKRELNFQYNKQDSKNNSPLSAKNTFNEKNFFYKTTESRKNNVYFNVKVDFNAHIDSLSTREEMESFAAVFAERLERELNTFAEGVHL